MAISDLTLRSGIYDPSRRFAFTNITDDLFTFHWDKKPISVKAHQTIELPHHLAVLATTQLVDKIMTKLVREDEEKGKQETKDRWFRSPMGMSLGVPAARKVWEDKILRELQIDEESPQIAIMRAEISEQIKKDLAGGKETPASVESIIGEAKLENMGSMTKQEFPTANVKKNKK